MKTNQELAKQMEKELLNFFTQSEISFALFKYAMDTVKSVKEYNGDKEEYLAIFEEMGSERLTLQDCDWNFPLNSRISLEAYESYKQLSGDYDPEDAEEFLKKYGSKYAWLANESIVILDLIFNLPEPFDYEKVWDEDEIIEIDVPNFDVISYKLNELKSFHEGDIVYQAGEGHLTNNIDEALALINKDMSEADDLHTEFGEEIYEKFFNHTLDNKNMDRIREYYDEIYGMGVCYIWEIING